VNEDLPFPPALPAVVPSPIGPSISYSNIRAVTSRAQSTLDQLEKKIKKKISNSLNDAGMVGARIETKIRDGINSRLAPHEQLYNDTTDFIQNQIAGNLAPAVATLEDLQGQIGGSQRVSTNTGTAGHGRSPAVLEQPGTLKPLTQAPSTRAVGLARQLQRAATPVVGGTPISPFAQTCPADTDPAVDPLKAIFMNWLVDHPQYPVTTASRNFFFYTPTCLLYTAHRDPDDPTVKCGYQFFRATEDANLNKILADEIISLFAQAGFNLTYTSAIDTNCNPPVDCTVHPLDPACPPDCKTHPEDPRCQPTTTDCPKPCDPPCIEVNVPPIPPCPPLNLPSCIQIDLCDWDKFCKFLTDCLVKSKEDCALDNDTAYTFKDCDGLFGEAQKEFLSGAGDQLLGANTIDDLATAGMALSTGISPDEYGPDVPY
jgi:hypothetical protein